MPTELAVVVPADHTWFREASLGSSQPMVVRYPLCPRVVAVGDFVDQHFGYGGNGPGTTADGSSHQNDEAVWAKKSGGLLAPLPGLMRCRQE